MSTISPELAHRIAQWRLKCADGTITQEEMRDAVVLIRQGRLTAAAASTASRAKKAAAEIPRAEDMLADLMK